MKFFAEWTDDCNGKKDYDGPIVEVSTRYWPRGGSFMLFDKSQPELGMQGSETRPDIKPSARSSILLRHGEINSVMLATKSFEAETEDEVLAQVENWVQEQYDVLVQILRSQYRI